MLRNSGRNKHTALDKLRASSTFQLLKEIYQAHSPQELADKLLFSGAFRREKIVLATSARLNGESCLIDGEIEIIAKQTARFVGNSNCESKILNYFNKGPEELFLALSGQPVSYYMDGPKNKLQEFVLVIAQLKQLPTESISFQIALSHLGKSLDYIKDNRHNLSPEWLFNAILEMLESKEHIKEAIPAPIDELCRREVNQAAKRGRPDRLFIHLPCDDYSPLNA